MKGTGDSRGFSLFELLVVIAIMGILAATALPRFAEFRAAAYDSRAQQELRNLAAAEELHRSLNGDYTKELAELAAFKPSAGIAVEITSAGTEAFSATAAHQGGRHDYTWNSALDQPLAPSARR